MREQVTWWDVEATGATSRPIGRLFPENSCFLGNGCRVREIPRGGGGEGFAQLGQTVECGSS